MVIQFVNEFLQVLTKSFKEVLRQTCVHSTTTAPGQADIITFLGPNDLKRSFPLKIQDSTRVFQSSPLLSL